MKLETVSLDSENNVTTIKIERPEAMNALNAQVLKDLAQCCDLISKMQEVRAVIITGSGDKAFVAGADINELDGMNPAQAYKFARSGQQLFSCIESLAQPVIAAVNGYALGGGLELALSCDFILASSKAKFALPECTLGIMPGFGGTVRIARRIGLAKAREMAYLGNHVGADEALQLGLVNHVYPHEELLQKAKEFAETMAWRSPMALAKIKRSILIGGDLEQERALEFEAQLFSECFNSQDSKEGVRAFLEKRKPNFKGN